MRGFNLALAAFFVVGLAVIGFGLNWMMDTQQTAIEQAEKNIMESHNSFVDQVRAQEYRESWQRSLDDNHYNNND